MPASKQTRLQTQQSHKPADASPVSKLSSQDDAHPECCLASASNSSVSLSCVLCDAFFACCCCCRAAAAERFTVLGWSGCLCMQGTRQRVSMCVSPCRQANSCAAALMAMRQHRQAPCTALLFDKLTPPLDCATALLKQPVGCHPLHGLSIPPVPCACPQSQHNQQPPTHSAWNMVSLCMSPPPPNPAPHACSPANIAARTTHHPAHGAWNMVPLCMSLPAPRAPRMLPPQNRNQPN